MSLWADYLAEREGIETHETEWGFVSYKPFDDETMYLMDSYIIPKHRRKGLWYSLEKHCVNKAKEMGYSKIMTSVVIGTKNWDQNLSCLILKAGYRVSNVSDPFIYLEKEID